MSLTLREKMILSLLPVAVGLGMIGVGMGSQASTPTPTAVYVTPSPAPVRYPDCGDATGPECVTWDDGSQGDGWYLVTGDSATLLPVRPVASYEPGTRTFWYELS